jgi:hypothetical protein
VLSQLPEIVRAAAEPMGNIGSLTVLSSDGASDIVRNTTRTVAEAGAAVKGLTGIDIPGLLAGAMGGSSTNGGSPTPPRDGGSSGGGGRELTRTTPPPKPSAPPAQASSFPPPATPPAAPPASASTAPSDPGAAFERAARQISDASRRVSETGIPPLPPISGQRPPTGLTDRAIDPPRPAPGVGQRAAAARPATPATARITSDTSIDDAAALLAADLDSVPGIERFGGVRLGELDRSGPRPLRLMWRLARPQLVDRYGDVTVGELLARYRGRGGGSASA